MLESCAILTTSAHPLVEAVHDRMPVILHPAEYCHWLDRGVTDTVKLARLFQPYPADLMQAWRVSLLVNNPRNDGRQLLDAVEQHGQAALL